MDKYFNCPALLFLVILRNNLEYFPMENNYFPVENNFSDGNYNGYGVMKHNQYEWEVKGDFKDGWPIKGKQATDWFEYEGELKYMLWHGRGKLTWWDDSVQEGNFERGEFIN